MKREQVTGLSKAILAVAVAAVVVGCGGSSGDRQPDPANQLSFDGGLSAQGADVSSLAATERTTGALVDDGNVFAEFIARVNQDIASVNTPDVSENEIIILGAAERSHRLLDLAFFSSQYDGDRSARLKGHRSQTLVALSSQELPEGEWTSTLKCPEGGELVSKIERAMDDSGAISVMNETLLQTFESCTVLVDNNERLVLDGTWKTETEERGAVETLDNGSVEGQWTDTFTTRIDLRGSRSGMEDVLVLDGALSGEESGDWSETGDGVQGRGTFLLNVGRMEARLAPSSGNPFYVGQLDGSLIEEFTFSGPSSERLTEEGEARISGKLVSSGMQGALSIRTEKTVRYAGTLDELAEACPAAGIVVVSGAGGDEVQIRFGEPPAGDTGGTGNVVEIVAPGDPPRLYASCAEADYLGPIFYGPFSQYADDGR